MQNTKSHKNTTSSCCIYHGNSCNQGRHCPVRKSIEFDPFNTLKTVLLALFFLACFGLVGELDYQDEILAAEKIKPTSTAEAQP